MLVNERFYSFLLKKNITLILFIILFINYFNQLKALEKISIITSLENLSDYPFIKKQLEAKSINLYGIWNDIGTGSLESYCHDKKVFESL